MHLLHSDQGLKCQQRDSQEKWDQSFVKKSWNLYITDTFSVIKLHWNSWKHLDMTSHDLHAEVRPGERKLGGREGGYRSLKHTHTQGDTHTHLIKRADTAVWKCGQGQSSNRYIDTTHSRPKARYLNQFRLKQTHTHTHLISPDTNTLPKRLCMHTHDTHC